MATSTQSPAKRIIPSDKAQDVQAWLPPEAKDLPPLPKPRKPVPQKKQAVSEAKPHQPPVHPD